MARSRTLCHRVVVAVTGSIAALWTARFILQLRADGYVKQVAVVMSANAAQFVTPLAMKVVSGSPVLTDLFHPEAPLPIGHVQITEGAGALLVMPATANILGKAAAGIADDAVSATVLAAACPVVFVPNMNQRMWRNPIVRRNVRTLKGAGYSVLTPATGVEVSTLREREGAMPEFDTVVAGIRAALR